MKKPRKPVGVRGLKVVLCGQGYSRLPNRRNSMMNKLMKSI